MGSLPRSLQSLLHAATPELADVLDRTRFLARVREAALAVLPPEVAPHLQVAAYDQHRLRLHVSHGGWATRLRYTQPLIAQALAQRMQLYVENIDVRVRRAPSQPARGFRRPRPMSAASREHLRRTARLMTDPELADALRRLAAAGQRQPDR